MGRCGATVAGSVTAPWRVMGVERVARAKIRAAARSALVTTPATGGTRAAGPARARRLKYASRARLGAAATAAAVGLSAGDEMTARAAAPAGQGATTDEPP